MKFKSKIDWWAYLVFAIIPIFNIWMIVMFILRGGVALGVSACIFLLLNIFLIVPIWVNTYYVIGENELLVRCGLGKGTKIEYKSIKNVKESRSPLASSGLSLDRIEISWGVGNMVYISPKNKQEFLRLLAAKTT
jgi:hypothetical protein